MITVYTQGGCQPCKATIRKLQELELSFGTRPAIDYIDELAEMGYASAPVVVVERQDGTTTHWLGYRPDLLKAIAMEAA
jgi:glutaredoxin-like protein NrdH